jgi:hypothetical protein
MREDFSGGAVREELTLDPELLGLDQFDIEDDDDDDDEEAKVLIYTVSLLCYIKHPHPHWHHPCWLLCHLKSGSACRNDMHTALQQRLSVVQPAAVEAQTGAEEDADEDDEEDSAAEDGDDDLAGDGLDNIRFDEEEDAFIGLSDPQLVRTSADCLQLLGFRTQDIYFCD